MATTSDSVRAEPRRSTLDRRVAMRLAAEEYRRFSAVLADLSTEDWSRPTDCPAWDVRQLACHVVGMTTMVTGIRQLRRQLAQAQADSTAQGIEHIDALTGLQVSERENWSTTRLLDAARDVGPRAVRFRRLTPFFIRRLRLSVPQLVNGRREAWSIGFLIDTVLTRDVWMHRADISRATGCPMTLTTDHDGVIVADVVAEWAARHGRPFRLRLTGPAGGTVISDGGTPDDAGDPVDTYELDAVQFCRILSGREAGEGLLGTQVPF